MVKFHYLYLYGYIYRLDENQYGSDWILIRTLHQVPADLDLYSFEKRKNRTLNKSFHTVRLSYRSIVIQC